VNPVRDFSFSMTLNRDDVWLCSGKLNLTTLIELTLDFICSTTFYNDFGSRWCSQAETYKALVGTSSAPELLETAVEVYETSNCSALRAERT
jgi:hypothetical protein